MQKKEKEIASDMDIALTISQHDYTFTNCDVFGICLPSEAAYLSPYVHQPAGNPYQAAGNP